VGWALQVPQNNELMKSREAQGDGNLAVALNESALYLGSAIGASSGGLALVLHIPVDMLSVGAGITALLGIGAQVWLLRTSRQRVARCLSK
jgi:predicted MFS family arabinose efflux permease